LLESFIDLRIPDTTDVTVIVVENDLERRSEKIVQDVSSKASGLKIRYYLEPRQGLAYARNRSVNEAGNCDFCCFVDDDQIVDSNWLAELVRCQMEFDADGVWGLNPPIFESDVMPAIRKFHTPKPTKYGEIVQAAFTNCLMLRKSFLDRVDGPFDARLNFTGGEDRHLTSLISSMGGIIRCNPDAIAYEIIPASRTTVRFYIKRIYRISNAALYVRKIEESNFSGWSVLPRLIMRFFYGLLLLAPYYIFGKERKLRGLGKMVNSLGGFAYLLNIKNSFYKA
jgi:succinoglycan biosynthesis protein ExoM